MSRAVTEVEKVYFSSLIFLFLYLPLVLGGYYLLPGKYRNFFLFAVNLFFYGWGEPRYILLMVFSMGSSWIFGWMIEKYRNRERVARGILVISVAVSLGILGFFKYSNFFLDMLREIPGFGGLPVLDVTLPIGISFYTFQTMSYTIDVYRRDTRAQRNFISYGTYVSFFPQLIAGPIVRYRDVAEQLENRRENPLQFADGIGLFTVGMAKKVLLANQFGVLWDTLRQCGEQGGILGAWLGAVAFMFQIYFDFSGYSDMARGLGKMFGFEFLENFNFPYIAQSITDFWRRWHISLSTWFRDYVYIPLGGNRKGNMRTLLNLLAVWLLTGLWHGANFNFVLWGLYYFVLLVLEKLFLGGVIKRCPRGIRHIYALFFVLIGWVIFYFEDFGQMAGYLGQMFTLRNGILGVGAKTAVLSYLPLLCIGTLACLPVWKKRYAEFRQKKGIWILETAVCLGVLLLCTAFLVSQSYNPFLYFRF